MSKPLIIANWKMNPSTIKEARKLFSEEKKTEAVICPPFQYLSEFKYENLCAQDCYWEEKGAYTGEVSPLALKDMGVKYVIIGHSERRNNFNETDEMINKKIKAALNAELIPILCVGEKRGESAEEIIERQLEIDLQEIPEENLKNIVIAYEPV